MKYFLSVLGLGDALITSRILDCYPCQIRREISLLTTDHNTDVVKKFSKLHNIIPITQDTPKFYNARSNSLPDVLHSFLQFRRCIKNIVGPGDVIIHEKQSGLRELCLRLGSKSKNIYPQYISNVYEDRLKLFNRILDYEINLSEYKHQSEKKNYVVINPCAGKKLREIPLCASKSIISQFQENGIYVFLLDFDGKYESIINDNVCYLYKPSFEKSASLLNQAKYYCGPDSFNLHLAYLNNCKVIGFYMRNWLYFKPLDVEHIIFYDQIANHQLISKVISEATL